MSGLKNHKKRILIVDDHQLVRCGLRDFLQPESDFIVCAEAGTARDALSQCALEKPDIALVDLSLGKDNGLDLIKDIAVQFPHIKMLAVSMKDEQLYAERVLRAGASGFIGKNVSPEILIEAVRSVLDGQIYASPSVTQRMMQSIRQSSGGGSSIENLSDRELAVFERLGAGGGTAAIAEAMSLSIKTIETYRARIKCKLNIQTSSELVQHAVQWSLEKG